MSHFLENLPEPEPEPTPLRDIGSERWLAILRLLGFPPPEARFVLARMVDGIKLRDLGEHLGVSESEVLRLQRSVARRFDRLAVEGVLPLAQRCLGDFGGNSRQLLYRQKLSSGRTAFALRTLDQNFQRLMDRERPRVK